MNTITASRSSVSSRGHATTPGCLAIVLAACLLLAACSHNPVSDAQDLLAQGRDEEGLTLLENATKDKPDNHPYRMEYYRQRTVLSSRWLTQADVMRADQQYTFAEALYQRVLRFDPANMRAKTGLSQIDADKRHQAIIASAEKLFKEEKYGQAQDMLAPVLAENPSQRNALRLQRAIDDKTRPAAPLRQLRSSITKPVTLDLKDVPLRTVFDVLGRAANLNFLFDKDVRADQRTSVVMRDAQVDDIIRLILATNQLDQRVLNESTALIYPNTPQKQRDYQDLVVKSFFLVNADAKQLANLIRTIVKTRDIYVDEKLNILTIKDTPHAIRLAEKLVTSHDLAEPEVLLEIEVLEVSDTRLLDLGMRYPTSVAWSLVGGATTSSTSSDATVTGTTTTTTSATGTPGSISLPEWLNRNAGLVRLSVTDPLFVLNLQQQDTNTNLLANPRVRIKNREKAKIHIGDRVPVFTTTSAVSGGFVSQSINYLDVGLKVEIEPLIYLNDDVGIKIGLEVSSIASTITAKDGTQAYQIGTRNAATVLRLRDGETQILAGLISDEDRRTANKVPGLGDLPVLGHLFGEHNTNRVKTEIMLLITPRLVRNIDRPESKYTEFSAGTETSAGGGPLGGSFAPGNPIPLPQSPVPPPGSAPEPPSFPGAPPGTQLPGGTQVPFGGIGSPPQQPPQPQAQPETQPQQ
jgi:general secretion pathway protein D